MDDVYELFQNGKRLLQDGDHHAATVPLSRARDLEPRSDSIREALGRAYFGAGQYREAASEFEHVAQHAPTDHYALFCLGRSLQQMGRHKEANAPLTQAALLKPDRADYRRYRDRARRQAD